MYISKPDPIMLLGLATCYSFQIFPKFLPIILFYSHAMTYYSYTIVSVIMMSIIHILADYIMGIFVPDFEKPIKLSHLIFQEIPVLNIETTVAFL